MSEALKECPEEYGHYKLQTDIIWKNKTRWAREYLRRKGQLDGSVGGIWTITDLGRERLRMIEANGKDPDEGRAKVQGIDEAVAETNENPEKFFDKFDSIHETGEVLGFRGIVFEPINEQGVILIFATACHDLGFRIEGIRAGFPDVLLDRKNSRGNFIKCLAEFEYKSAQYKAHKHPLKGCDLIICWENDWKDCPIEVLELKSAIKNLSKD